MELIPILSTIILVATISTFLLAIGAYILYKIREGKQQEVVVPRPQEVSAELVTPAEERVQRSARTTRIIPQPGFAGAKASTGASKQPVMFEKTAGAAPSQPGFTPQPKPYQAYKQQPKSPSPEKGTAAAASGPAKNNAKDKAEPDSRFLKYTSEGYIPAKEDKDAGALKWR